MVTGNWKQGQGNGRTLNDYCVESHSMNFKWWLDLTTQCPDCGGSGGSQYDPKDDARTGCEACRGYGYRYMHERNTGEMLMLMVSEIAEAMESHRKGLKDDKLPQYDGLDVELVDCLIRIFDLLGHRGVDVEEIYQAKMAYNAARADHQIENRLKAGGKKY